MHHSLTKYLPHITLFHNNITLQNHGIIPRNHSIILRSLTRCLSTMHHKEIELATKVEDEVEEGLEETED
jgi:hypothetical protein